MANPVEMAALTSALVAQQRQLRVLIRRLEDHTTGLGLSLAASEWRGLARQACETAFINLRFRLAHTVAELREAETQTARAIQTLADRVG